MIDENVPVSTSPNDGALIIGHLPKGISVTIVDNSTQTVVADTATWVHIRQAGIDGWVKSSHVQAVPTSESGDPGVHIHTSTFGTPLYQSKWNPHDLAFAQCHEVPETFGCSDEGGGGTDSYVTGYTLYGSTTPLMGWNVQECDRVISDQVSASIHDQNMRLDHCIKLEEPTLHRGVIISKLGTPDTRTEKPQGLPRDAPVTVNLYLFDEKGHVTGPTQSYSGNDTITDGRNGYTLQAICDVSGDGAPEIVIRNGHYFGFSDIILQFNEGISEIHGTNYSVDSKACGC